MAKYLREVFAQLEKETDPKKRVSDSEITLYVYYCERRNEESGGWDCPNAKTGKKLHKSRSRVSELRKSLRERGWIKERGDFIMPVLGFKKTTDTVENSTPPSVEKSTESVENSTGEGVEKSTDTVEFSTESVEISTAHVRNNPSSTPPVYSSTSSGENEAEEVKKNGSKYLFEQHLEFAKSQKGIKLPELYADRAVKATEPGHIQRVDAAYERWIATQKKSVSALNAGEPMPVREFLDGLAPGLLREFLGEVSKRVNYQSFNTWFAPISELSRTETEVCLSVPTEVFRDWLINNYTDVIEESLEALGFSALDVKFIL